jgi:mono/diheme cytochrome c family protein
MRTLARTLAVAVTLASACAHDDPPPSPPSRPTEPIPTPIEPTEPTEPTPRDLRPALPIFGGHGLVANGFVYMADPERDMLFRFHEVEATLIEGARQSLPRGSMPFRLAALRAPYGDIHVTLRGTGAVARVSAGLASVEGFYHPCDAPRGIAWDVRRERVLVACAGGELVAVAPSGAVLQRVSLEPDLRDVVVDETGAIFVSVFRAAEVLELDEELVVRARHELPDEHATDPAELDLVSEDRTANTAWRMRAAEGGGVDVLYQLSTRVAVAPSPTDPSDPTEPPPEPEPAPEPDAPPPDGAAAGYGPVGTDPGCVRPVVSNAISRIGPDRTIETFRIGGGKLLVDFVRDGLEAFVANASTRDGESHVLRVTIVSARGTDGPMQCIGFADDGGFRGRHGVSVEVYGRHVAGYARNSGELSSSMVVRAPLPEVDDLGHQLFHQAAGVDITCASCHAEGRDDGLVWDFGDGPRRTQSLLGGVTATAPFHWKGDVASMTAIMERTFVTQMGGSMRHVAHTFELERWLDTLPVEAATVDADAAARGAVVFESAGCASCHQGDFGTQPESATIEGEAWQVPMLRGVGLRAPYFHDGCAATLRDAVEGCEGHAPHPGTDTLTPEQRDDLAAFLARWD